VSGAKGLKAGWVTFHVIEKDPGEEGVMVTMDRQAPTKAPAATKPPQGIRRMATDKHAVDLTVNVTHAPSTLPRDGVLRVINTDSGRREHLIMLVKPKKGATKASIAKYFAPNSGSQFNSYPVTGFFNPLSAGHCEYESYHHLKPGRYAFVDGAADDKTGHIHARDGSVRFVTVK
jgi:hypothetical protein